VAESKDLRDRTKKFAVRVIRLVDQRSKSVSTDVIGRQLVRSATSIGANYRAACRAEFIAKLQIALEDSDESMYWLELMLELDSGKPRKCMN